MDVVYGPPLDEDAYHALRVRLYRQVRRGIDRIDDDLWDFLSDLDPDEFGFVSTYAMRMLSALVTRWWIRDHHPWASWWMTPWNPSWLAPLILLALRAVSPEPVHPGRPDDAVIRVASTPLVRAHSVLTAAPPASHAPVLAGAAA